MLSLRETPIREIGQQLFLCSNLQVQVGTDPIQIFSIELKELL